MSDGAKILRLADAPNGNADTWSVADMLKKVLADIESGETNPVKGVFVFISDDKVLTISAGTHSGLEVSGLLFEAATGRVVQVQR